MKTLKTKMSGKILTSIVVIFTLASMALLTSCTAVVRTPRQPRTHVVVDRQITVRNHDNGLHLGKAKRHEKHGRQHRNRD